MSLPMAPMPMHPRLLMKVVMSFVPRAAMQRHAGPILRQIAAI